MKVKFFVASFALSLMIGMSYAKRVVRATTKRNSAFELTLSLFKSDVGSIGGHTKPADEMIDVAWTEVGYAVDDNRIIDGFVFYIGDDVCLLLSHDKGKQNNAIHDFADHYFQVINQVGKKYGCCSVQEALLPPRVVEMTFQHSLDETRPVESFMAFATHKNETAAPSIWSVLGWEKTSDYDSIALIRTQGYFESPEKILSPFVHGELLPVPINTAATGPLGIGIVSSLGFSVNKNGQFSQNYVDFFNNPAWDWVRLKVQEQVFSSTS